MHVALYMVPTSSGKCTTRRDAAVSQSLESAQWTWLMSSDYPHHVPVCGCPEDLSWKQSLDLPGPAQLDILRAYFLSLPSAIYDYRRPAQELLVSTSAPEDRRDRDARIDLMRDFQPSGKRSWVIAHTGMGYEFTLDLVRAFSEERPIVVERLNPRTGERDRLADVRAEARVPFQTPTKGSVKDDWVFILTQ